MKRLALSAVLLFVTLPAFADSIKMVGNTFAPDGSIVDLPLVLGVDHGNVITMVVGGKETFLGSDYGHTLLCKQGTIPRG